MTTIAIMAGGNSSERKISLKTAQQILESIDKSRFTPVIVDVKGTRWMAIVDGEKYPIDKNTFSFQRKNRRIRFRFAWIAIHGTPGENGMLQGYLDCLNIPYSSCSTLVSALTFDKHMCKMYLQHFDIHMAKSILVREGDNVDAEQIAEQLGLPLFVKPNTSGSSFGVSKVKKSEDIVTALKKAFAEDKEVIVEAFISGTEVSCGVFKSKKASYVLPVTEIVSPNEFFDYHAKYFSKKTQEITPARISDELTKLVQQYTSEVYDALHCHGIVRVDFIISNNIPYFLEINSVPGMSRESIIPKQLRTAGIDITSFLSEVIDDRMRS